MNILKRFKAFIAKKKRDRQLAANFDKYCRGLRWAREQYASGLTLEQLQFYTDGARVCGDYDDFDMAVDDFIRASYRKLGAQS